VIEFWLNQKAGLYLRAFTVSAHPFAFVPGMLSLKKCNALGLSIPGFPGVRQSAGWPSSSSRVSGPESFT
jgi:hypothetical protein